METKEKKPKKAKETIVSTPKVVDNTPKWEMKDRSYFLKGNASPLTYVLASKSTKRKPLLWFDEEKGYNRELRYASNQRSCFVDEQDSNAILEHIVFENGTLFVPKEKQALQKLLSMYHPRQSYIYEEVDDVADAKEDLISIEIEMEALNTAMTIDIDQMEAILRVEQGSAVDKMSSSELKRDLYLFARENPVLFLDLVNDENVILRNLAIKATEMSVIILSQDQRTFSWGTNNKKLMNVPFDENPYSAFAAYLKTICSRKIFF